MTPAGILCAPHSVVTHCYLPLYIFCGRHLLAAKLRRSNIDASAGAVAEVARIVAQIRSRWSRGTSASLAAELQEPQQLGARTGKPARRFKDLMCSTLDSWSRARRVVEGRMDGRRSQSTFYRHFAIPHRARGPSLL
jgi:hypothetical protein